MARVMELYDGGGSDFGLAYANAMEYQEIEEELTRPCHACEGLMFETGFRKVKGSIYYMWRCQECGAVATLGEGVE